MTQAVPELLDPFDKLTEVERRSAFAEILKRSDSVADDRMEVDHLTLIAESCFLKLDAREAADGHA